MKTYQELTERQKRDAVTRAISELLEDILEENITYTDSMYGDLQHRLDTAIWRADDNQTPWLAHGYIMNACGVEVGKLALDIVESSLYAEDNTPVVYGII